MKIFDYIIVEVETHSKNEVQIGGKNILIRLPHTNLSDEAVECGIVKMVPPGCNIPKETKLYFHRSVTAHTNTEQETKRSNYHLKENEYLVPYSDSRNLTFGYFKDNEFIITGNYSLLKAKEVEETEVNGIIIPKKKGYEGFEEDTAIMQYPTEFAKDLVGYECYLEPRRCYLLTMEGVTYWAAQDNYLMAYATP